MVNPSLPSPEEAEGAACVRESCIHHLRLCLTHDPEIQQLEITRLLTLSFCGSGICKWLNGVAVTRGFP